MSSHYYRNAKSLASAGAAASAAVEPSTKTPKRKLIGQSIKSSSRSSRSSRSLLAFAFLLLLSAAVLNSCFAMAAAEAESAPPAAAAAAAVNGGKAEDKEAAVGDDEAELGGSLMAVKRAAARTYNFGLGKRGGGGGGGGGGNGNGVNPSDLLFTKDKLIDFLLRQQNGAAGSNGAAAPSSYYYQSSPGGYVDNYGLQAALYVPESLGIKRSKPQRFSFGLGKRTWALRGEGGEGEVALENNIEAGESAEEAAAEAGDANGRDKRKAERYQFGLGKRSPFAWFTSTSGNGSPKSSRSIDEFKRRYNFGLGK